jgi:hypothetical protein
MGRRLFAAFFFYVQSVVLATSKALLTLDRGFYDFDFFALLIKQNTVLITRAFFVVAKTLMDTNKAKDYVIFLGMGQNNTPVLKLRLMEVRFGKT